MSRNMHRVAPARQPLETLQAMIFTAMSDGTFDLGGRTVRCALGMGGVIAARDKREGDGASPLGTWAIRRVLYRPDKGEAPETGLPTKALARDDGWGDAPLDPAHNPPRNLPHPPRAQHLRPDDAN